MPAHLADAAKPTGAELLATAVTLAGRFPFTLAETRTHGHSGGSSPGRRVSRLALTRQITGDERHHQTNHEIENWL